MKYLLALIMFTLITACSTHDALRKPIEVKKLEPEKYQVYFRGTSLTSKKEALEIWHHKAKDVCEGQNYEHKIIQNKEKRVIGYNVPVIEGIVSCKGEIEYSSRIGCAIGSDGLVPTSKITKGTIRNGIYTSPQKEFTVAVPNWGKKFEYMCMQIKEQFADVGQYLSFGPAYRNQNIYRLEFARKLSDESYKIKLETVKDLVFDSYIGQIEKGYKSKAILLSEKRDQFKAVSSFSRLYKQHVPAQKKLLSSNIKASFRYHAIDIIDYGSYNVFFWVEIAMQDGKENIEVEKAIINGRFNEHISFVESFKLL